MASIVRIHRLLRLVELLQSGRHYNSAMLADLCGVSRRSIFRDLKTLQESGLNIVFDEERQGYSMPATLFLPPTDFTIDETLSILVVCHELGGNSSGIPFQNGARSAAMKLLSNLPRNLREYVGELTDVISVKLDSFNPLKESKPVYNLLQRGILGHQKVRIRYQSLFEGREISTLLSPYRMVFIRRSWYVIGRSSLHREVRTFHIGRIREAELTDSQYQIPPRFTLERYLGNAWHLIRDCKQESNVVVRFQPKVATNVAEVRWHKTQEIKWNDDGSMDFHATVDGLGEIVWWILGYGDQAEVIKPAKLRQMVIDHIESMQKTYAKTQSSSRKKRSTKKKTVTRKRDG